MYRLSRGKEIARTAVREVAGSVDDEERVSIALHELLEALQIELPISRRAWVARASARDDARPQRAVRGYDGSLHVLHANTKLQATANRSRVVGARLAMQHTTQETQGTQAATGNGALPSNECMCIG